MRIVLLVVFLNSWLLAYCQQPTVINTKHTITFATVDRTGELYCTESDGSIHRYSTSGVEVAVRKFTPGPVLFNPHDGARLFLFQAPRTVLVLDANLETKGTYTVDSAFALNPMLVAPHGDLSIVLVDADFTLRKIHLSKKEVEFETQLPAEIKQPFYLREHLNFVFLLDPSGIYIFNRLGIFIRKIAVQTTWINFIGSELYYPEKGGITYFDLLTTETYQQPSPASSLYSLFTDELEYRITATKIEFRPMILKK